MRTRRLRRTGVPALVGLTIAGTMTLSTGTASAGAWLSTGYYFPSQASCSNWAGNVAGAYGWTAWDCRYDPSRQDGMHWLLFAFEG
ncbi:hypothetical protein Caci_5697 [Catenulispora acidiphila DSM 44928]|uniref:Uncharacterized protein n=1 Tax=Catenulispora acidiphila (strain DSM 44928 / JCM 14897 / NBRC 102108 / NRRL B-24433 / ID139908) TaxID=479433 RepID=C7QCA7_CATAD|nr:hypothetical protein [Catenulispora acidiphila]ACU74555.1 hypothetical protein Caci_5697 [Catenulispora acidiphila DSM 44928]